MCIHFFPLFIVTNYILISAEINILIIYLLWIAGWSVNVFGIGSLFYLLATKSPRINNYFRTKRQNLQKTTGNAGILMLILSAALLLNPSMSYAIARLSEIKLRITLPIVMGVSGMYFTITYLIATGLQWVRDIFQFLVIIIVVILILGIVVLYFRGKNKNAKSSVSTLQDK